MDTKALELFAEVVARDGFTAAARAREADPSAGSRAIAALERELGFRLFERSTRRVALTEAGAAYHARIAPILADLAAARDSARDLVDRPRGRLRISASTAFGEAMIVPMLPAFRAAYPEVEIDLVLSDAQLDLIEHRIDLAVRLSPEAPPDTVVARLMNTDLPVLVTGESGTGKSLIARAIHDFSDRRTLPFVTVAPADLADLEGPAKVMSRAKGGTVVIDEVGDLDVDAQARVVRMMDAPGDHVPRFMATSLGRLADKLDSGDLREDLYYRLNVVNIKIPPLDERREDIPLLVSHFLQEIAKEAGQERKVYAPEAVEMLVTADWPGNIRQLYNVVRQNVALSNSPVISAELVRSALGAHGDKLPSFSEARDEFTRNYLSQILQITGGNVSQAARLAKRNRTDFYKLLARHDLNPDTFKEA